MPSISSMISRDSPSTNWKLKFALFGRRSVLCPFSLVYGTSASTRSIRWSRILRSFAVRKFFLHDDELEEFDDEELFEDEDDDSDDDGIEAFDDESEIFEDEAKEADKADAEKAEDTSESSEEPAEDAVAKDNTEK